jgi:hypothetical protein
MTKKLKRIIDAATGEQDRSFQYTDTVKLRDFIRRCESLRDSYQVGHSERIQIDIMIQAIIDKYKNELA